MIGILGGTFDPVHAGHLHVATQVYSRLGLQQLQFMPCSIPVHRERPLASAEQRCAMLELAIAAYSGFVLNRLELQRDGPSYSVDSLRRIREDSSATLVLILGTDAFNGFSHWKDPEGILRLAHLVVCHRPGVEPSAEPFPRQRTESPEKLHSSEAGSILFLQIDANDCSSSEVRKSLIAGESPDSCLDPAVATYIQQQQIYRKSSD